MQYRVYSSAIKTTTQENSLSTEAVRAYAIQGPQQRHPPPRRASASRASPTHPPSTHLRRRRAPTRASAARPCGSPAALRSIGCSRQRRATLLEPAELGLPLEGTSRVVVAPYSRTPT